MKRGFVRNIALIGVWLFYPPFVLLIYLITYLDLKLKFALPFPRDIDELAKNETWCINELKRNMVIPETAKVGYFNVTPLKQAYIFRSSAGFITINYRHDEENKTLKCFAKFAPTMGTVWNRTIFNIQMNHIKEIFFNQYIAKQDIKVPAPKVYVSKIALLTGNLCLITEYMEDCMEYPEGAKDDFPGEHLEFVMEGMARLHASCWKESSKRMNKVIPIHVSTVDLFDSMVAFKWSLPARKILVKSWSIMNRHETVIHGDARVGNMMFPSSEDKGRFVFIDWQAVRKGKGIFDVAYFIILSLTRKYREACEQHALDDYHRYLKANGVQDYSREEMEEDYRHACLCVLVLLSLPMLSGEASVEGDAAVIFAYGMNIWRLRLQEKFENFDYPWLADHYGITEQEGKQAIEEMLDVIYQRLKRVTGNRDFENLQ